MEVKTELLVPKEHTERVKQSPGKLSVSQLADGAIKILESSPGVRPVESDSATHLLFFSVEQVERITINTEFDNVAYAKLQERLTGYTTADPAGKQIAQRILIWAKDNSRKLSFSRFAALNSDESLILIPTTESRLVEVSASGTRTVPNAANDNSIYVEHPTNNPFRYLEECDTKHGLSLFEKLAVDVQAAVIPEQKWLVAVRCALLPYVRQLISRRLLLWLIGQSQHGKTSGLERFTYLHGLESPFGNVSSAFVQRMGDIGLLALDNLEQSVLTDAKILFLLFQSTGATAGRATQGGDLVRWTERPIVVVDSIEGAARPELVNRVLAVEYGIPAGTPKLNSSSINAQIVENRNLINSSLVQVLVEFLRQGEIGNSWAGNFAPLSESFREDSILTHRLLLAYAVVSGRDRAWAESVIQGWFPKQEYLDSGNELAPLLHHLISEYEAAQSSTSRFTTPHANQLSKLFDTQPYSVNGADGKLYLFYPSQVVTPLRQMAHTARQNSLPKSPEGMRRRLSELKMEEDGIKLVTAGDEPKMLKRTARGQRIGLFVPSDNEGPKSLQEIDV